MLSLSLSQRWGINNNAFYLFVIGQPVYFIHVTAAYIPCPQFIQNCTVIPAFHNNSCINSRSFGNLFEGLGIILIVCNKYNRFTGQGGMSTSSICSFPVLFTYSSASGGIKPASFMSALLLLWLQVYPCHQSHTGYKGRTGSIHRSA